MVLVRFSSQVIFRRFLGLPVAGATVSFPFPLVHSLCFSILFLCFGFMSVLSKGVCLYFDASCVYVGFG
jgi:hypothetical protein